VGIVEDTIAENIDDDIVISALLRLFSKLGGAHDFFFWFSNFFLYISRYFVYTHRDLSLYRSFFLVFFRQYVVNPRSHCHVT